MDLEKKVATSEPLIKSLSADNETFKNKVAILATEAKNGTCGNIGEKPTSGEGLLQAEGQVDW